MLDLEKEVFHHSACQFDAPGTHKSADDEIAVPTVHFVETPARYDIGMFQVEKSMRVEGVRVNFARLVEHFWKRLYLHVTLRFKTAHFFRHPKLGGWIQRGFHCD